MVRRETARGEMRKMWVLPVFITWLPRGLARLEQSDLGICAKVL